MLQVSQLNIYPIKSLGGTSVPSATLTDRGFEYDRRWMLVDNNNRFLSQREIAGMALLQVDILPDDLKVNHKQHPSEYIKIPLTPAVDERITVDIWGINCEAQLVGPVTDKWFSEILKVPCRLVYMAEETIVKVEEPYAINNDLTSFSDGYPILMIGEASLQDLNDKMEHPLPMNRFRPNVVFTGGEAFLEDKMEKFTINGCTFFGVKQSARCVVTTIDQHTTEKGKEPLKTLSAYRRKEAKVYFGQNVIASGRGEINVGDRITILQTKESLF